ncbi:hypothetical protein OG455_41555 [Kitasatospora sp. NBC_01287]|uniref:hypothetical protein n=1 Tax=Kitasatospora sp. NBC_01287 TaxID=2903573 RepID=UPI0022566BE8|nr:hypothetical protein [Kitasatospora sp. NBC_01287]MCX4750971.1 hypothetical protein [Kitasatospora sp. NBC_01287]MCX4751778.1 hypothetical protein [Kitasatospora sp. NBC_01287]MCX4751930.1 hypothetical protein [Kitasatospora sp. NBC_01287]
MSSDWAGTTEDMFDLHRFTHDKTALCNPTIRTYSSRTPHDQFREPYMTLRSRAQIEATGFGHRYTFCLACDASDQPNQH